MIKQGEEKKRGKRRKPGRTMEEKRQERRGTREIKHEMNQERKMENREK